MEKKTGKGLFSFFGHRLGRLFDATKAQEEELPPIEMELEWSLEEVRKKLEAAQESRKTQQDVLSRERVKQENLMEKRNQARARLFRDIVDYHGRFATGLKEEELWSPHGFMKNAAGHETDCSSQEVFHKHIECHVLSFLRYLGFWEKNSASLLKKIEANFLDRIREIGEKGKKAGDLSEVFVVSRDLQRISTEEIPQYICGEIQSNLQKG
ncbi:MAG: hypothetical protein JW821_17070 [Deltaproteobacteria bacterium]|nr:hypothetical protein [Deltaproteobacteria bacterium]